MNEDLDFIQYSPIRDYKYAQWFEEVQYNGKTLSDSERKEFVGVIDDTIEKYSEVLPLMHDSLESTKDLNDEFHELERTLASVMLFVLMTMIDSMVASKYFIPLCRRRDSAESRALVRFKCHVLQSGIQYLTAEIERQYILIIKA